MQIGAPCGVRRLAAALPRRAILLVPFQLNEANLRNSAVCKFVEQMRTGPRRHELERH